MSVRSIEAEVYIHSGIEIEVEIGREVTKVVEELVTDLTPEEKAALIALLDVPISAPDIEPLTVTENGTYTAEGDGFNPVTVNVEAPTDPNVIEGEFIGTETGVLTIDTGYKGDSFIKRIEIQPSSGSIRTDDGFLDNAFAYAVNTLLCASFNVAEPNYDGTGSRNRLRVINLYKSSDTYNCAQESPYAYDTDTAPSAGTANVIKIPSNHQLRLFVSDVRQGNSTVFATGIRYKYKVFY